MYRSFRGPPLNVSTGGRVYCILLWDHTLLGPYPQEGTWDKTGSDIIHHLLEGTWDQTGSDIIHPLMDRMTQTCKNITFPATSFAGGNRYITVHNNLENYYLFIFMGKKLLKHDQH